MAVLNFDIKTVKLPSGEDAKAVFLTGSIDATTNQTFEGRLSDILQAGTRHAMLVLTNVKYINSTGLGTIVKCVDSFREKGGDIKLVGVPAKVIALFEMLGLLALFETYDTIEAAVASFGKAKAAAAPAAPTVKFPLQFKHPVTGMGLNASQAGRFKDPRSGDYFQVDADGTIAFYEMSKVRMAEFKFHTDIDATPALVALATSLGAACRLGAPVVGAITRAIQQVGARFAAQAGQGGDTCNVILVGDPDKLSVGFVAHGPALHLAKDDPLFAGLDAGLDEVKHLPLPSRGHLLSLTKKA
jgi:anti-sigma B factor antagonist